MSIVDDNNTLLREQLGKGDITVFNSSSSLGTTDFYCVYFPIESTISSITVANATDEGFLQTTMPAGTTLFMRITGISISGGVGVGYTEHDNDTTK